MNDIFVKVNSSFKSITDLMKQKLGGVMCPYGVGDIYITTSSTNPASKWSGTTWTQITGRFLLAAGDGYTAGNEGGEATHKLTQAEMANVYGQIDIRGYGDSFMSSGGYATGPFSKTGYSAKCYLYNNTSGLIFWIWFNYI